MRVLGIDPGLGRTGYALVDGAAGRLRLVDAGRIDTETSDDMGTRLLALAAMLGDVIAAHTPEVAAVEEIFFSTNRRTAMRVSEARGVILFAVARAGLPVAEYTPAQVKQAVCGYGGADKQQVTRMTRAMLSLQGNRDDVADACAIAVCHHHRGRLGALVQALAR
jgi:crossover junction endodeoxyribonuclease RuvC